MHKECETEFDHGVRGYLAHDSDCESPLQNDDAVKMFVFHRRYVNPAKDTARDRESMESWAKANPGWEEFPLYMYDHSGTAYRVSRGGNPFSCPWDSGRVGSLFLKKSEFSYRRKGAADARFKAAQAICESYTSWANGDCWGYVIEGADGAELDSCWGFIGQDYALEEMKDSAAHYVDIEGKRTARERDEATTAAARALEAARPDMYALEG